MSFPYVPCLRALIDGVQQRVVLADRLLTGNLDMGLPRDPRRAMELYATALPGLQKRAGSNNGDQRSLWYLAVTWDRLAIHPWDRRDSPGPLFDRTACRFRAQAALHRAAVSNGGSALAKTRLGAQLLRHGSQDVRCRGGIWLALAARQRCPEAALAFGRHYAGDAHGLSLARASELASLWLARHSQLVLPA